MNTRGSVTSTFKPPVGCTNNSTKCSCCVEIVRNWVDHLLQSSADVTVKGIRSLYNELEVVTSRSCNLITVCVKISVSGQTTNNLCACTSSTSTSESSRCTQSSIITYVNRRKRTKVQQLCFCSGQSNNERTNKVSWSSENISVVSDNFLLCFCKIRNLNTY